MGLLQTLRRLSPVAGPKIISLPQEELSWSSLRASPVAIPTIEAPQVGPELALRAKSLNLSDQLVLPRPDTYEHPHLDQPKLVEAKIEEWSASLGTFEIVDLLQPIGGPTAHGTIFVRSEEEVRRKGKSETRSKVEPPRLKEKLDPRSPKGLGIFEMLLPILMPPAASEFRDDLLFPQELHPFQRAGVRWLFENESALLADDMGLGKTVQSISAFRALIRRSLGLQALVVCPKSIAANWVRELSRWAPELVVVRIDSGQPIARRRLAWRAFVGKCHVLVTTYETVRQDQESIRGRVFDLIVADEAQRIKNPNVAISRAMRNLSAKRRWGLSGTPLENQQEDLVVPAHLP